MSWKLGRDWIELYGRNLPADDFAIFRWSDEPKLDIKCSCGAIVKTVDHQELLGAIGNHPYGIFPWRARLPDTIASPLIQILAAEAIEAHRNERPHLSPWAYMHATGYWIRPEDVMVSRCGCEIPAEVLKAQREDPEVPVCEACCPPRPSRLELLLEKIPR